MATISLKSLAKGKRVTKKAVAQKFDPAPLIAAAKELYIHSLGCELYGGWRQVDDNVLKKLFHCLPD